MRRNTPLAGLHVITATNHSQKKGLVDHLKICKKVPGYDQRSEEELQPYKCPNCFRNYAHRWDMLKQPLHLSPQEIDATGSHSDCVIRCSVHLQHCGVRFNHVKLFICGFVFVGAWRLLGWLYIVLVQFNMSPRLYSHLCSYIMSPALLYKSSIQSGNPQQCALAFTHLLSSSCTH